jgi:anti-sigma regulatory factor (Ser/Thr protein kinase)
MDSKVYLVPGAKHDVSRILLARPEAAAQARRTLVGLALPESTREALTLIVSELVGNAVRHAGLSASDPIRVQLTNGATTVRLAVHDGGPGFTSSPSPRPDDALATAGRGLLIVAALSESWGVEREPDGCTVWCEIAAGEQPVAEVDRVVTSRYVHELAMDLARGGAPTSA